VSRGRTLSGGTADDAPLQSLSPEARAAAEARTAAEARLRRAERARRLAAKMKPAPNDDSDA